PNSFFDEPKFPKFQSLIPGVVELRFAIRLLLRVRGDERKRSHIVVLGGSEWAAVSEEEKSYDFGVLKLSRSGSGSCFRASSSCQANPTSTKDGGDPWAMWNSVTLTDMTRFGA
ncbi:hypothetical protein LINPERHAP2_LOCUS3159, partial [Linum perenne]